MIKLENDIPIPPRQRLAPPKPKSKYPITIMQPGQSFFVKSISPKKATARMHTLTYITRKRMPGTAFAIRTYPNGVRVWRIA